MGIFIVIMVVVLIVILTSIRQISEYERGILFQFGKYKKILNEKGLGKDLRNTEKNNQFIIDP